MTRALELERSVVRQLAMRRTVFAFPRDLLPAVWGSASARVSKQLTARLALEVEAAGIAGDGALWLHEVCSSTREAIREQPGTAAQLRARVPDLEQRLPLNGPAGGHSPVAARVLTVLAADGSVVRGRNDGGWRQSRPVWTATDQWLGAEPGVLDEAAGYSELVRRWLLAFGPGTEADLTWWLGATKSAVRRALVDVGAAQVRLQSGDPAWVHPEDTDTVVEVTPWAALLPALDPTTMGWRGRDFYLGDLEEKLFDRNGNGGPTAWWNGRIVGGWTQRDDGSVVIVPAVELPREATSALDDCAQRLTEWLDGDVVRSVYQSPLARAHPMG